MIRSLLTAAVCYACGTHHLTAQSSPGPQIFGPGVISPGVLFSYYALLLYIPIARVALAEGKRSRTGVASGP